MPRSLYKWRQDDVMTLGVLYVDVDRANEDATTMYVTVALTDMKDGDENSTRRKSSSNSRKPSNV